MLDLVDLVRGPEAVEEVEERDPCLEGRRLGDQGEVLHFLHGVGAEHGPAGGPGGHDVALVAEDRQAVGGQSSRGDVEDRRGQLAGDLVHVGNHQEQALRRRERRRQRPSLKRAMAGAGRPALVLHLDDRRHHAVNVLLARGRPGVGKLAHGRRWGDRVDGDDLVGLMGHVGRSLVPINRHELPFQVRPPEKDGCFRGCDLAPDLITQPCVLGNAPCQIDEVCWTGPVRFIAY